MINITTIAHRFEMIRTVSKPSILKTTHKMFANAGPNGDPTATPSSFL